MAGKVTTLYEDSAKTNALYPRTKASAVSDSNNNTLTEVGFYTAETVGSGVDNVKVAFDMDLLWTNSDPSATFPAQTISLDLSDYKVVLISVYVANTLTSSVKNNFVVKGETTEIQPPIYNGSLRSRTVTVSDSGISFSSGIFWNSYNNSSSAQTQDVQAIPYKIYGIR